MILFIFVGISVFFIVENVSLAPSLFANASDGDGWSCETIKGVPCPEGMMGVQPVNWKIPTLRAYPIVTCMDIKKTVSEEARHTKTTTHNDKNVVEISCRNPSTPCLTDFSICIQDPFVLPIRLDCKYLKDFEQENEDAKCGANAAKQQTYTIDSGYNITKFDFNYKKVRFEQAVPETEPTYSGSGNDSDGDNWSCQTIKGAICPKESMVVRRKKSKVRFLSTFLNVTCMDAKKTLSDGTFSTNIDTDTDKYVLEFYCPFPSTPWLTDFSVCFQDPSVPPIRLDCRYLKDFEKTEILDVKCGANGLKQNTYTIDSGYNTTKFDFNCEKVRFERAVPETEPTYSGPGNASEDDNWSCETIKGGTCPKESFEIRREGWIVPSFRAHVAITCTNTKKTKTFDYGSRSFGSDLVVDAKCSNPSTPCLTNFQICIQNHKDPAIRLHCRYLKDFEHTRNKNRSAKCGANGAKKETYSIKTGFYLTKFKFNCQKVRSKSKKIKYIRKG